VSYDVCKLIDECLEVDEGEEIAVSILILARSLLVIRLSAQTSVETNSDLTVVYQKQVERWERDGEPKEGFDVPPE
jgi:hypothetical protein